jgi:serine phosphatase RsbU (regulator of sigma subunit)
MTIRQESTRDDGPPALPTRARATGASDRVIATIISQAMRGEGYALLRQLPVLALVAGASLLVLVVPSAGFAFPQAAAWGFGLLALATVLAVAVDKVPGLASWHNVALALDIVALALLRSGTGPNGSLYAGIVILVVVWLALNEGRRYVTYSALGASVTVLLPILVSGAYLTSPTELLRSLFTAVIYTLVALTINEVARQARRRYERLAERENDYAEDLHRGAETQRALLPSTAPPLEGWELVGRCLPATVVGGDFYDWYPAAGGYAFTLVDVMGKGVGAGIVAATARSLLRTGRNDADPVVGLRRADEGISSEFVDATTFGTAFHARLAPGSGQVTYVDAGHGLAIVVRAHGSWRSLPSTGAPIGLGLELDWSTETFTLQPGDTLVCMSDGMLDLYPTTEATFEAVAAMSAAARSARELVQRIAAVAASVDAPDDVTVVALRRTL